LVLNPRYSRSGNGVTVHCANLNQRFGTLPESMIDRLAQFEAIGTQTANINVWLDQ
jgi:hypothetical protein